MPSGGEARRRSAPRASPAPAAARGARGRCAHVSHPGLSPERRPEGPQPGEPRGTAAPARPRSRPPPRPHRPAPARPRGSAYLRPRRSSDRTAPRGRHWGRSQPKSAARQRCRPRGRCPRSAGAGTRRGAPGSCPPPWRSSWGRRAARGAALPAGGGRSGRGRGSPLPPATDAGGSRGAGAERACAGGRPPRRGGAPGEPRSRRSSRWRTSLAVTIYGGPLNARDVTAHIRTEERGPAVTWAPACGPAAPRPPRPPAPRTPRRRPRPRAAPRGPPPRRQRPSARRRRGGIPVAGPLS